MFDTRKSRLFRSCLLLGVCVTLSIASTDRSLADDSQVAAVSLPVRGAPKAGFKLSFACEDIRLFGDVPTFIRVDPDGGKFSAARKIVVRVTPTPRTSQPPGMDVSYEIPIELPENSGSITKSCYLPKWTVGGSFEVVVLEDRRLLEGYQGRVAGVAMFPAQAESTWWESSKERFRWIVDDSKSSPDARIFFATVAPELLNFGELENSSAGVEFGLPWRAFQTVPLDQLPEDWRGFDAADVWVVDSSTLNRWMERSNASSRALRAYLRCGGTLWVLGKTEPELLRQWFQLVNKNSRAMEELRSEALKLAYSSYDYDSFRASAYQTAMSERGYLREAAMQSSGRQGYGANAFSQTQGQIDSRFENNLAWYRVQELDGAQIPAEPADFEIHPLALGRIVVCNRANAVPGSPQQWRTLMNLTDFEASETLRRGVDPSFGDRRFWDWIIPNVAQPPVYTFIGLLCAFVIVVGPLAYRKFTKLGRGYLMMFVAPLLALVTTLVMFAYGLLADGLSTSARVREVTWIADGSGDAARYCRSTYFAGVRPSSGMSFPANSTIVPYQLPSVNSWFMASQQEHSVIGSMRIDEERLQLDSGFLPSRQQKQFITYRPVEKIGLIRVEPTETDSLISLTSELAMDVRSGILRTAEGRYFQFDRLAPKQQLKLKAVNQKDASERLSELYAEQRPLPPAAVSSSRRAGTTLIDMVQSLGVRNGPRQVIGNRNTTGESQVEAWLRMTLQIEAQLNPGMFIALADVSPDCIAVEGADLVESVHYVIGVIP